MFVMVAAIGCEFQILDDKGHADALCYGQDNTKKRFNGIGTWNRARIEVRGSKVSHHLNGGKVVEYERGTQLWKAIVAYSKYAEWPAYGEAEAGHILLQDHGDQVSFRNIKILELKDL